MKGWTTANLVGGLSKKKSFLTSQFWEATIIAFFSTSIAVSMKIRRFQGALLCFLHDVGARSGLGSPVAFHACQARQWVIVMPSSVSPRHWVVSRTEACLVCFYLSSVPLRQMILQRSREPIKNFFSQGMRSLFFAPLSRKWLSLRHGMALQCLQRGLYCFCFGVWALAP